VLENLAAYSLDEAVYPEFRSFYQSNDVTC